MSVLTALLLRIPRQAHQAIFNFVVSLGTAFQSAGERGLFVQSPGSGRKRRAAGGFATCLPGVCSQSWKHTRENKKQPSHPDVAELRHHLQGRTKAPSMPGKGGSANSDVGLWSPNKGTSFASCPCRSQTCCTHLAQHKSYRVSAGAWNEESKYCLGYTHHFQMKCVNSFLDQILLSSAAGSSSVAEGNTPNPSLPQPSNVPILCHSTATTHQAQHIPLKHTHGFHPGSDEPKFNSFLLAQGRLPSKKNVPQNTLDRQHRSLASTALTDGGKAGLAHHMRCFSSQKWSGRFCTPPYSIMCALPLNS